MVIFVCFFLPQVVWSQLDLSTAEMYFQQEAYTEVIKVLEPLKDQDLDVSAIEMLGDAYSYTLAWDRSIKEYNKLVGLHPDSANYHYKLGGALAMKALTVNKLLALPLVFEAKDEFLKASALDTNHINSRWALVKIYMELPGILGGSKTKALQFAEELEALSNVDGYLCKGYIYELDKDYEQAELYYKRAVEVGGSKLCYTSLSEFYLKQNETDKAIRVLKAGYNQLQDEEFQQKLAEISQ